MTYFPDSSFVFASSILACVSFTIASFWMLHSSQTESNHTNNNTAIRTTRKKIATATTVYPFGTKKARHTRILLPRKAAQMKYSLRIPVHKEGAQMYPTYYHSDNMKSNMLHDSHLVCFILVRTASIFMLLVANPLCSSNTHCKQQNDL